MVEEKKKKQRTNEIANTFLNYRPTNSYYFILYQIQKSIKRRIESNKRIAEMTENKVNAKKNKTNIYTLYFYIYEIVGILTSYLFLCVRHARLALTNLKLITFCDQIVLLFSFFSLFIFFYQLLLRFFVVVVDVVATTTILLLSYVVIFLSRSFISLLLYFVANKFWCCLVNCY